MQGQPRLSTMLTVFVIAASSAIFAVADPDLYTGFGVYARGAAGGFLLGWLLRTAVIAVDRELERRREIGHAQQRTAAR